MGELVPVRGGRPTPEGLRVAAAEDEASDLGGGDAEDCGDGAGGDDGLEVALRAVVEGEDAAEGDGELVKKDDDQLQTREGRLAGHRVQWTEHRVAQPQMEAEAPAN